MKKPIEELQATRETPVNRKLNSKKSTDNQNVDTNPSEILDGTNLPGTDIGNVLDFSGCSLRATNFHKSDIRNANFRGANLRGSRFRDVDLSDANLQRANLVDADLEGADLSDADLREANPSFANLRGTDLSGGDLRGANLTHSIVREADLSNAILVESNLPVTDCVNADLSGTDSSYANYRESDLRGADFTSAILDNTNFSGANLQGADFAGSFSDSANLEGVKLRGEAEIKESINKGEELRKRIRYIGLQGAAIILLLASMLSIQTYYQYEIIPPQIKDIVVALFVLIVLLLYGYLGSLFIRLIRNAESALEVVGNESGE